MNITLQEAAYLLQVSKRMLYRWVQKGVVPAYRFHDEYRFNQVELEEWAINHRQLLRLNIATPVTSATQFVNLSAAIVRGGIYYHLTGNSRDEILAALVMLPGIPRCVNSSILLEMLRTREALASTALGEGIAIPHPRSPLVLGVNEPTVLLGFLKQPVDFGAIDGRPIHIVFLLLSPTIDAHLQTLARISAVLQDEAFRNLLEQCAPQELLLKRLAELNSSQVSCIQPSLDPLRDVV